ncbi:MAG TPA: hypothetical protein LFV92_00585 [Rickettsia endosymbiont of Ceroptres masudai]|nr:hypothetical protein [Rickettsia endosymbiont of Ceroptres masudai]
MSDLCCLTLLANGLCCVDINVIPAKAGIQLKIIILLVFLLFPRYRGQATV